MADDLDEIIISMEANEDETEVKLVFSKKTRIDLKELILSIEEYMSELLRAEKQMQDPNVEIH